MNYFDQFLVQQCVVEENQKILSSMLYDNYMRYIKQKDPKITLLSNISFTRFIKEKYPQYENKISAKGCYFHGITLKSQYKLRFSPAIKIEEKVPKIKKQKYNQQYYKKRKEFLLNSRTNDKDLNICSNKSNTEAVDLLFNHLMTQKSNDYNHEYNICSNKSNVDTINLLFNHLMI